MPNDFDIETLRKSPALQRILDEVKIDLEMAKVDSGFMPSNYNRVYARVNKGSGYNRVYHRHNR